MSLKNIEDIKLEYRTLSDEVVDSFYIPCLQEACIYKRAVGYFSSGILLQISKGLGSLAKRGGKIKLLVSPKLDERDYEAIKNGYEIREYVVNKMVDDFDENIDFEQKNDRFSLLSYLITSNILDIKVAIVKEKNSRTAMYHEKLGIIIDNDENMIAFSGSANETEHGYNLNYECIDTFCSWNSDDEYERCNIKNYRFDKMWEGEEEGLITIPFPTIIKNKLLKYNNHNIDYEQLDLDLKKLYLKKIIEFKAPSLENVELFTYQENAIQKWKEENFCGIFDMATGTGKTYTGCGAIVELYQSKKRIIAIICCPYTHLVDQWCEEVKMFGMDPIKCYGGIKYFDKLKRQLLKFKNNRTNFVCVVISNSSFQLEKNQQLFELNLKNTLLLVDEAHNFGAANISKMLKVDYLYRLALSATLDRHGDEYGTKKLYDFFGRKCIQYDLGRAISEGKLTPYLYYPILVYLDEDEFDRYQELTEKIKKFHYSESEEMPTALKNLLISRSRIVAGAKNKITTFLKIVKNYQDKNNIIVYCGAVKYGSSEFDDAIDDKRQIEEITYKLNKELNIISTKFTAEENTETRQQIIHAYKNEEIQALVAIKCLDEGMNIPSIKTAFILASSNNPKEYIQRRGRVLRKFKGKKYAEIYDFITLPRPIETVSSIPDVLKNMDIGLVKKELARMIDFANLSSNPSESNDIIQMIKDAYSMNIINEGDVKEYE